MENIYEGVMFKVKGTVLSKGGETCAVQHEKGESWLMRGIPEGICSHAFAAMFPAYWVLRFGGKDPNEENPDEIHVQCSRKSCGATFLLERISDEEAARMQEEALAAEA